MGYIVDGVKYDYDSIVNQEIKRKFVGRDVYCCVTTMTNYILRQGFEDRDAPFTLDDITNYYKPVCPECGSNYGFEKIDTAFMCDKASCEAIHEKIPTVCTECEDEDYDFIELDNAHKCENCGHIVEDILELDTEPDEIYEWWMVSDWFAERLSEKGECVLLDEGIWGRSCTGQAILLDWVISQICYDMEILEGQKYSWAERRN